MIKETEIEKHIKKGFGKGKLREYIPWIKVNHFSSQGRSHRIFGHKTNRVHHLLSDLELRMFDALSYSDEVIDIREQYPLLDLKRPKIELTKKIASQSGIKHPQIEGANIVMTTDFLITLKSGIVVARTVKPVSELENPRVIEKFEVERLYWKSMKVDWAIVTDVELSNSIIFNNLSDLRESYHIVLDLGYNKKFFKTFLSLLMSRHNDSSLLDLSFFAKEIDDIQSQEAGRALRIIKYLMAIKAIRFELNVPLQKNPIVEDLNLKFNADAIHSQSNMAS